MKQNKSKPIERELTEQEEPKQPEEQVSYQLDCAICKSRRLQLLTITATNSSSIVEFVCLDCGTVNSYNSKANRFTTL